MSPQGTHQGLSPWQQDGSPFPSPEAELRGSASLRGDPTEIHLITTVTTDFFEGVSKWADLVQIYCMIKKKTCKYTI